MKSLKTIILILFFSMFFNMSIGQIGEPGDPGGEPETGDPFLGGGAPIGSGLFILLGLGAAYGGKKVYHMIHHENDSLES